MTEGRAAGGPDHTQYILRVERLTVRLEMRSIWDAIKKKPAIHIDLLQASVRQEATDGPCQIGCETVFSPSAGGQSY